MSLESELPERPRKIAVLRASRIGDFVCATPSFRALKNHFRSAQISLIALPAVEPLALRLPYVDRFIPFPGFPGMAEQLYDREKAALEFSEQITRDDQEVSAQCFDRLRQHFSEAEIVELTFITGYQTFASKFAKAFGLAPQGFSQLHGQPGHTILLGANLLPGCTL